MSISPVIELTMVVIKQDMYRFNSQNMYKY